MKLQYNLFLFLFFSSLFSLAKTTGRSFSDFGDDAIIKEEYKKCIRTYCDEKSIDMLYVWSFANEIVHRIELTKEVDKLEQLNGWYLDKNGTKNAITRWEQIKKKSAKDWWGNKKQFEEELYQILRNLLILLNGETQRFVVGSQFEKQNLKKQIILKNLLKTIGDDEELSRLWMSFWPEYRLAKFSTILRFNMGDFLFGKMMAAWQKMMAQIEMDQDLFEKSNLASKHERYLLPTFPLISQQLFTARRELVVMENAKIFQNNLTTFLYGNEQTEIAFKQQTSGAIVKITKIVAKWSNKRAKLLVSGSMLLNCHTIGSDVNLVCITPGKRFKVEHFMGSGKKVQCLKNKCTGQPSDMSSFYCQICENNSTTDLVKIQSENTMIIRFNFDGIPFDISLVTVPETEILGGKINDNELEMLLNKFNWEYRSDQKSMIRTLSSYRSTFYINNLFNEGIRMTKESNEMIQQFNFRHLLMTIKIWAKNKNIYSNKMGFLNGMTLAIMAAKIVLLYPIASMAFLLEKFFLYYSTRLGDFAVQLAKISYIDQKLLTDGTFSLLSIKETEMLVLTPSVPAQNAARLVTHSNAKVIRRELFEALKQIKLTKDKEFDLNSLFNSVPFTQKYQTYIVINCMGEQKEFAADFCEFVEWKMRLQITFDIDKKDGGIEIHLCPNVYQENCILPSKLVKTAFSANYCKVWLLGTDSSLATETVLGMAQQFDLAIIGQYIKAKGETAPYHLIELKSVVMNRESLGMF